MISRNYTYVVVTFVVFGSSLSRQALAELHVDPFLTPVQADSAETWESTSELLLSPEELAISSLDDEVTPVQMLAPQPRTTASRMAQRPRRSSSSRRSGNLSSVPFMIGDTGAGSCVSFNGLIEVELAHPTLACSRLNISENNTPVPIDRWFFSYRHFHNATSTRVYQFNEDFNYDRFTLGGERTFFDQMMSVELRLPLEGRLSSDLYTQVRDDIPVFTPLSGDRRAELGNISAVFKALLMERQTFAMSAGLGVTLPTAQDVTYGVDLLTTISYPDTPGLEADTDVLLDINVSNETVYLAPFLAWLCQPNDRWFHQGFLQVEVAANPTGIMLSGDGYNDFYQNNVFIGFLDWQSPFPSGRTDLIAQTLLRLNLGWGYTLHENTQADWIQKLTGLFEVHYSSTLNAANFGSVPVFVQSSGGTVPLSSIDFGNHNNRIDIVNLVAGLSANVGNLVITNGITTPIKRSPDRGFDFEYNLQIQRPF